MRKNMKQDKNFDEASGEPLRSLGSIGQFFKGKGISKADLVEVGVPCLRYADIYTKYGDVVSDLKAFASEQGAMNALPLIYGDIVFAASGETAEEIGKAVAYLGNEPAVVGGDTVVLRGHGQNASFLAHALNAGDAVRQKSRLGKGQSIVHIHAPDLSNVQVWLPSLPEQNYTATLFSSWDNAIEILNRLISAKRQSIRGILAESVSDAREDAKNDGWVKTTIGEVVTLAQQRVTWDEEATYRLITVRRGCGGLVFRGDRKGHEILTKDMYTVRAGDFLISKRQVVHGAWAMVPPEFDGAHVSKEYACLRAKLGKLWMPYFDWLSRTERLQHEAFICSYGVDIEKMVLNVDWLLQTPLLLPRSIETQKAMAAGLDCMQCEVELLQAQTEALRKQKCGLMQKLLTGEWRVPVRGDDVNAMNAHVIEEAAQ